MPLISDIALRSIAFGARIPRSKNLATFDQWSSLIDLITQLRINVFLDVGANRGFYSKHLRNCGYKGELFSFEPIPSECEHIERKQNGDKKWKVLRCALGAENGTKQFHLNITGKETVLSSFLPLKGNGNASTIPVDVRRLDDILAPLIREIESPRIFLKMDTQGFDDQVLKGASGCMDIILGIQSEVSVIPLYEGMPSYTESLKKYGSLGFDLVDLFVVNRTSDGRVLEYDCLMKRQ